MYLIYLAIYQSIKSIKSINQSIHQSNNQSTNQSINPSINQPTNQSINPSINQSINRSLFTYLSTYLPSYLLIYLFIFLSFYLIYLSTRANNTCSAYSCLLCNCPVISGRPNNSLLVTSKIGYLQIPLHVFPMKLHFAVPLLVTHTKRIQEGMRYDKIITPQE